MDRTQPTLNQINIVSRNIWQAVFMGFSPLLGNVSGNQKVLPEADACSAALALPSPPCQERR